MNEQDLKAELERLKAENEALKNRGAKAVSLKVSEKGGVSVYGLGRFPVTLYKEQWIRLLRFPLFFAFQAIALMPPVSPGPESRSSLA
jgi:hypothetical protein